MEIGKKRDEEVSKLFDPLIWFRFSYIYTKLLWSINMAKVLVCMYRIVLVIGMVRSLHVCVVLFLIFFLVCLCMCGLSAPCDVDRFQSVSLVGSLLYDFVWSQSACYPPFCITI